MTGREKLLQRMEVNAEQFCESFPTAGALLQTAMMEAMPWVIQMKTQGMVPNKSQLERLATQILAILLASLPPEPEQALPVASETKAETETATPAWIGSARPSSGARMHSFK